MQQQKQQQPVEEFNLEEIDASELRRCLLETMKKKQTKETPFLKKTPGPLPKSFEGADKKRAQPTPSAPPLPPQEEEDESKQTGPSSFVRLPTAAGAAPVIVKMKTKDIHPAFQQRKDDVRVHMHMRADPSWAASARKKQKVEPPPPPSAAGDYETKLLQLCKLIAGQPLFHGKMERVWDEKGATAWRGEDKNKTLDSQNFDSQYMQFLTPDGFAVINRGATLIRNAPRKHVFTLLDVLNNPLFWNDFVGLATVQRAQTDQQMYAANGRYFSGRAYEVTYNGSRLTSNQHLRAFELAVKNADGTWRIVF